jgi:hypothetical protein
MGDSQMGLPLCIPIHLSPRLFYFLHFLSSSLFVQCHTQLCFLPSLGYYPYLFIKMITKWKRKRLKNKEWFHMKWYNLRWSRNIYSELSEWTTLTTFRAKKGESILYILFKVVFKIFSLKFSYFSLYWNHPESLIKQIACPNPEFHIQ